MVSQQEHRLGDGAHGNRGFNYELSILGFWYFKNTFASKLARCLNFLLQFQVFSSCTVAPNRWCHTKCRWYRMRGESQTETLHVPLEGRGSGCWLLLGLQTSPPDGWDASTQPRIWKTEGRPRTHLRTLIRLCWLLGSHNGERQMTAAGSAH